MIKKFFISIILCFSFFGLNFYSTNAVKTPNCTYNSNWDLSSNIDNCFKDSDLVKAENLKVDWNWFKNKIIDWRNRLLFFIWIFAVFWLAFSGFTLVTSAWNDEKINKAKWIFKWTIIWFLAGIFASAIITIVINLFYSIK